MALRMCSLAPKRCEAPFWCRSEHRWETHVSHLCERPGRCRLGICPMGLQRRPLKEHRCAAKQHTCATSHTCGRRESPTGVLLSTKSRRLLVHGAKGVAFCDVALRVGDVSLPLAMLLSTKRCEAPFGAWSTGDEGQRPSSPVRRSLTPVLP